MTVRPTGRPGAVFIGDHLAMDFLNSVSSDGGEWLGNGADLIVWLEAAGVLDLQLALKIRTEHDPAHLDSIAERARGLRDWLRGFLHNRRQDLGPLNALLAEDVSYRQVVSAQEQDRKAHRPLQLKRVGRWTQPEQVLQPLAAAIADLLCNEDLGLVRTCEAAACTLMFVDRTKAHARRWCSMAVCGNRAKAAAHRARTRK
jgi:predicted RNA-binding Zn ribbon-like protein